ncbi:MAG: ASPIC/UnbV domain-containing protein, partial [Limisphaerales bacterium]
RWAEVSDEIGAETLWPWGLSVGDLNADGYEDVFVTAGMGFGFRYGVNSALLNDQGRKFLDSELVLGIEPRAGGRTFKTAFVLDCSGADQDHPFCAGRSGPVEVKEALSSRSSVIVDLDRDGDLDIVTLDMNDRPQVLLSDLSARRSIRYLEIGLTGTRSNRDGLGATVRVHAGGRIFTQYHAGKSGYLGQSSGPLYFGLPEAAKVDRVEVSWPSGSSQSLTENLPLNGLLTITEPAGP